MRPHLTRYSGVGERYLCGQSRRFSADFSARLEKANFTVQAPLFHGSLARKMGFVLGKLKAITPVESAVLPQSDSGSSKSPHAEQVLELLRKLMEYRSAEVRHRLEKVGRAASMLHMDVLLLIYHFAKFGVGNILEIGPYIGGSTIAAAFGARESDLRKKIVSIEAGGRLKHFRLSSRNIIKDFKENLARFSVAEYVTLIHGRSFEQEIVSAVRQTLDSGEVGLFIFDADNNVRRDLDCYGNLLADSCWLVIDDYFGPPKAASIRAQLDELVSQDRLLPLGYYGWGTWIGQWQRK
jgi:predicted O-methyltransferase YrrM